MGRIECPYASYYGLSLRADQVRHSGKTQVQHEISSAFHYHVSDANKDIAGDQAFPWADETPNALRAPPFISVESGSATVADGCEPGSGTLRFERADDYDTFVFFARSGSSYSISTHDLASAVDTFLEVLDRDGSETVLASADDCGLLNPRPSCLTFSAPGTGFYRVRVSPHPGSAIGPGKTYSLSLTKSGDDIGDALTTSAPLAPDGVLRVGAFETPSDVDVFRVSAGSAQTLSYLGCSGAGISTKVEVLNVFGTVIASNTNTSCSSAAATFSLPAAGTYFLRASSALLATGSYSVKALLTQDLDVDGSVANAWTLSNSATTGRLIATRFETMSDEDWYKFTTTTEGRFVIVETFGLATGADTVMEIYAPTSTIFGRPATEVDALPDTSDGRGLGHWMIRDDDGALAPRGSRLAFIAPVAGTYYVRVRNVGAGSGRYLVAFEDTGVDSPWSAYP